MPHHFSYYSAARAALLALSLTMMAPVYAQSGFHARVGAASWATGRGQIARVTINDQPVATLRVSAGGIGPVQRALSVKRRLSALVDAGLTPPEIGVAPGPGRAWEIQGRGAPLLLVTPRDAAAQHQSPHSLALGWAKRFKARLAEAPLTLSVRQLLIPVGISRAVAVGGAARASDISVTGADSRVSQVVFDSRRRQLVLLGTGTGQVRLRVSADGASLPLTVSVAPFAAQVQPHLTVTVTGKPVAPAALVRDAVFFGLKRILQAQEGAQVRLLHAPEAARPLPPGATQSWRLPLRVAGAGLLPVEAAPLVTVVNRPIPDASAAALFYSNNPEQVRQSRTLFTGRLPWLAPVRLDFHHQNRSGRPLVFHVDAVNTASQAISLHLLAGVAPPEADTVQIGRRAGALFLDALDHGAGLVLRVPPHTRLPLVVQRFAPNLTVSGILQVRQLSGPAGAATLEVIADEDRQALASSPARLALASASTDGSGQTATPAALEVSGTTGAGSPFIFGPPRVSLAGAYAVGGVWEHLRLGNAESLRSADGSRTLWGNYGVSYFVTLSLSNPTKSARPIGIFFAPEAGAAAGVFQVSGSSVVQFDPMFPPDEKALARVRLAPGETRIVRLRTILLNGSAYPASLVVHAL